METLSIEKSNALKAYAKTDAVGKNLLENLFGTQTFITKITDRIKTLEDVFEAKCLDYNNFLAACEANGDTPDEVAYKTMKAITEVLNEGWKPDWNNSKEAKWYIWFENKKGSGLVFVTVYRWRSDTRVGSRLCFKNADLAKYAATQFPKVYSTFMNLD
ncbi:MAG: hypothetical protein WCG90_08290 [Chitinophagia bacterium]